MCVHIEYSKISKVKVLGPDLRGRVPKGSLRDGDGDGRCKEQGGKWVPCPPGLASGSVITDTANWWGATAGPKDFPRLLGRVLFNRDEPLTQREYLGEIPNDPLQNVDVDIQYENYVAEFNRRKRMSEIREAVDEEGNYLTTPNAETPEIQNQGNSFARIFRERREKAAKKAQLIQDAANDVDIESNLKAAGRFYAEDYSAPDSDDWDYRYRQDNPEPDREDFETDEDYEDAVREYEAEIWPAYEDLKSDIEAQLLAKAQEIFNYSFTGLDGETYDVEIEEASSSPYGDISIVGRVYDKTGRRVAEFERTFGTDRVDHNLFTVNKEGVGIASSVNAINERLYERMGIEEVVVHALSAGGWVGVTHWSRNGFNWQDSYDKKRFLDELRTAIRSDKQNPGRWFATAEERGYIEDLVNRAELQNMSDPDAIVAADLVQWEQADSFFSRGGNFTMEMRREVGQGSAPVPDMPEDDPDGEITDPDELMQAVDDYLVEKRNIAKEKADKISGDAKANVTSSQRQAVRNTGIYEAVYANPDDAEYEKEQDLQNWDNNNPEPTRDNYDNDDDYEEAHDNWEEARDNEEARLEAEYALPDLIIENIRTAFNHTIIGRDGQTYQATIDGATPEYWDGQVSIYGSITNAKGEKIGGFTRTFTIGESGLEVYHDNLGIYPEYRNAGLASAINARNEILYRELGVGRITVSGLSGSDHQGAQHWPRNGFNWADGDEKDTLIRIIQDAINNPNWQEYFGDQKTRQIVQELLSIAQEQDYWDDKALTAADLLQWPGVDKWFTEISQNGNILIRYTRDI